jgi:hypothetical protein
MPAAPDAGQSRRARTPRTRPAGQPPRRRPRPPGRQVVSHPKYERATGAGNPTARTPLHLDDTSHKAEKRAGEARPVFRCRRRARGSHTRLNTVISVTDPGGHADTGRDIRPHGNMVGGFSARCHAEPDDLCGLATTTLRSTTWDILRPVVEVGASWPRASTHSDGQQS